MRNLHLSFLLLIVSSLFTGCSTLSSGVPLEDSSQLNAFVGDLKAPPAGYEYAEVTAGRNVSLKIVPAGQTAARTAAAAAVLIEQAKALQYGPYGYSGSFRRPPVQLQCTDPRFC